MEIKLFSTEAKKSLNEIKKYQTGEKHFIVTGREYLDNIFPVVNGSVIALAAGSGVGKSYELMRILTNVLNVELNPRAENFVVLNISLEMKVFNLVLRDLNRKIKKKKLSILKEEFTEEELQAVRDYQKALSEDKRQYISQVPTTPDKFYQGCKEFLEQHRDKDSVFIAIDHMALISPDKGDSKNSSIERVMEYINNLKMEFENVIFIPVSQTNSNMVKRAREKDRSSQPVQSDLYYSGFIFQIADYVVVIVNPSKLGITDYSKLPTERYPNLDKFFVEIDNKGRGSLESYGVNYYHLLKCRESENGNFLDIYAEELNFEGVEKIRTERREETAPKSFVLDDEIPTFTSPSALNSFKNNVTFEEAGFEQNECPF